MNELCSYASKPFPFIIRYLKSRPWAHGAILGLVLAAVACSVTTQYAVKLLVDTLAGRGSDDNVWLAFAFLVALIGSDCLLWRLASWIAIFTFVGVSGDVRRDLFRHLTGHAPSYFTDRLPGVLTSRITATSNAIYTIQNMFVWNVLPPCAATVVAMGFMLTVSGPMAAVLLVVAAIIVVGMFHLAAAGKPLHHEFSDKAAAVDGEMVDVVSNMPLVRAFGGISREHHRFNATLQHEMGARERSLIYLEKLRVGHALITIGLTIGLLAWGIVLWEQGAATTGAVVLVCTLGLSVLHATRDLAVALVDVTQHMARLSEALSTLLLPHELRDHPEATPLIRRGARVTFDNITFGYGPEKVFSKFDLDIAPGQRVGLIGRSGSGKSTLFALLQRFYDVHQGNVRIDGQNIARVTRESVHGAISVVPQDISLFNRSLIENIRYGRHDASDDEVLQAIIFAGCQDFIKALPYGFATIVGDRGLKLSGGQRQRIAIARAFLKDTPILLLDEATSAVDIESEQEICAAMDRLMRGRTVIAIAHRLSTLRSFDRIVVMNNGRIEQDGPPDRLLRADGPYRRLLQQEITRLSRKAA